MTDRVTTPARSSDTFTHRRLPIGAELMAEGVHFRVWAPEARRLVVLPEGLEHHELNPEGNGYFAGFVPGCVAGTRYRLRVDDNPPCPDPASRYQPEGPHGPSEIVDPGKFVWTDGSWPGVSRSNLVVYEMHIGTFTRPGSWRAAARELEPLAELGITVLEVMPVADFAGRFGWGYDGVALFAPTRLYGSPEDFRHFVDTAHGLGLGVILDVVYNHCGPDGCCLERFSPFYFSKTKTGWGAALNFDGPNSTAVREFYVSNAAYWVDEFHVDGLRIDAANAIADRSDTHVLTEIARAVRKAAGARTTWLVCENEQQTSRYFQSEEDGGIGLDAMWNDDFHHTAMVAATGRREAYYKDYLGSPQEFISAAKHGFLFQGQWYSWQNKARGTSSIGMPYDRFVTFLQNHDQIGNSVNGLRLHEVTSPGKLRALTAVLLLGPSVPMLFQGQEFASSAPFFYFADLDAELVEAVRQGRRRELSQFASIADADEAGFLVDPCDPDTFERCKLDHRERHRASPAVALHASLLQLRTSEAAFRAMERHCFDGAVIGPAAFVFRYFGQPGAEPNSDDRLLVVNLGTQLDPAIMPEPLLAPPLGCHWSVLWSSDDPLYGGPGTLEILRAGGWSIPPECAFVLSPLPGRGLS